MKSRNLAVAVGLASLAVLSVGAAPAGAVVTGEQSRSVAVAGDDVVTIELAPAGTKCSGDWKKAVGIPLKWQTSEDPCGIFGAKGYKAAYGWVAERGTPCIKVRGFNSKGKSQWYDAGCGKKGSIKNVPWGNVLGKKAIQVKGASLLKWQ